MYTSDIARKAVKRIMADLSDRSGFELDALDEDIQNEIRQKWIDIIEAEIIRHEK